MKETEKMKPQRKGVNRKRAFLKISFILAVIAVLVFLLSHFISDQQLDVLKHSLDLSMLVVLLIIINLVSFACFLVLFAAYQWVRGDLKVERDHDLKE